MTKHTSFQYFDHSNWLKNEDNFTVNLVGELLENSDFETGTFGNWRTIGNNQIVTADFGVAPTQGTYQAFISNGESSSGNAVIDTDLEEFLDLAPGVLDNLGNGNVTEGSAIKYTFDAEAGDILSFDWNFLTNQTIPSESFNDFAFFSLTPFTSELADTNFPSFEATSAQGFTSETGYQTITVAISETGTYTLDFGVVDVEDNVVDSALLVDNIRLDSGEDENEQVFEDPQGDTFGFDFTQLDIASVSGAVNGEELILTMEFFTPITAPSNGSSNSVVGYWDLDLDQNATTGVESNQSIFAPPDQQGGALGVEVYLDLFSEEFQPGLINLIETSSFSVIGSVPISYDSDSLEITIPLSLLGDDGNLNYGTVIGTFFEPTDVAPNTEYGVVGSDDNGGGDIEPNDTINNAIATGLFGEGFYSISSEIGDNPNLAAENDVDLFELSLDAGDQLIADIDASDFGSSLDPILSVFNSQGDLVAQNDDFDSLDSLIDFTAEASDTYYVGVSSFSNFDYNPFTEGSGTGGSSGFYDLFLSVQEEPINSEFNIELLFTDNNLTPQQQAVFTDAANRWSEIIIGDLPDVFLRDLGLVDDLVIDVSTPFIDGVGQILGQAAPTIVRTETLLPARGIMEFDIEDIEEIESEGLLEDLILHEMGHVLGIGSLWEDLNLVTDVDTDDPRFIGFGATDEYNDLFGVNELGVPVEADGGQGTALVHWDEAILNDELMTGFINFGDNPLSRITAASLGDLGYEVNVDVADFYLPSSTFQPVPESLGHTVVMSDLPMQIVTPVIGYDSVIDTPWESI